MEYQIFNSMNFFLFNLNILIVKKVLLQINVNVNVPGFIFFYITDIVLYVVTQNYNIKRVAEWSDK